MTLSARLRSITPANITSAVAIASKMDTMPDELRSALNAKIKANGFGGYRELAEWLEGEGFAIGKTSLAKYGKSFKDRLERLRDATQQAKFLAQEFPDDDGSMNDAILRNYQAMVFTAMEDMEINPASLDPNKLGRVIADISRASVSQKKLAKEIRDEVRLEAANDAASAATAQGLGKETVAFIRAKVLGQEL